MDLNGKLRDLRDQGNISAFNGKLRQEGLWPADETKAEQNARDFIFNLVTAIESADEICGIPAPYLVELKGTWKSDLLVSSNPDWVDWLIDWLYNQSINQSKGFKIINQSSC